MLDDLQLDIRPGLAAREMECLRPALVEVDLVAEPLESETGRALAFAEYEDRSAEARGNPRRNDAASLRRRCSIAETLETLKSSRALYEAIGLAVKIRELLAGNLRKPELGVEVGV